MSNVAPQNRKSRSGSTRSAAGGFRGLPTWSGIAVIFAALVTGLLISLAMGAIGVVYLSCFAVAGIVVALLVELRGLFLSVAVLPLLFAVVTPVATWLVSQTLTTAATGFSTTSVITAVYPLLQYFPLLVIVTLGAGAIAGLRLWLYDRQVRAHNLAARRARRRDAEAERVNRDTATRARQQSTRVARQPRSERTGERVTVEELMRRNDQRSAHSLNDDLYSD